MSREPLDLDDPLEAAIAESDQRLRDEPAYRDLARRMLERFAGPHPPPALAELMDRIDQLDKAEGRLRSREEEPPPPDD